MIIDFHTHCFSDTIAPKAMANLCKNSLYPPHYDGTLSGLKANMLEAKVDISVILNIATNPAQTPKVNDWALQLSQDKSVIPFGSINPFFQDYKSEIKRLHEHGIKGIKFHPDYQDYFADDKTVYPIYEEILKHDMLMSFHCGHDLVLREPYRCTPEIFSHLVADFGGENLIGAHLGGQDMWDDVFAHLAGKRVNLDTSFGFKFMTKQQIERFTKTHPADMILFATDGPWQCAKVEVEEMKSFISDKTLLDKILYLNAKRLLKI